MVAVKDSKFGKATSKETNSLVYINSVTLNGAAPGSWMNSTHPGAFLAASNDDRLPCDCHGILEQAMLERCHGNNDGYVQGLDSLAKCFIENKQLSCSKRCREKVLGQADFIADYGVVVEGAH